jgi:hypothetical protein
LCTSRTIEAQLLDTTRGGWKVRGPDPGHPRRRSGSVSIPMEDIAHTVADDDSLALQITSSAGSVANLIAFGVVDIYDVTVELPIRS